MATPLYMLGRMLLFPRLPVEPFRQKEKQKNKDRLTTRSKTDKKPPQETRKPRKRTPPAHTPTPPFRSESAVLRFPPPFSDGTVPETNRGPVASTPPCSDCFGARKLRKKGGAFWGTRRGWLVRRCGRCGDLGVGGLWAAGIGSVCVFGGVYRL